MLCSLMRYCIAIMINPLTYIAKLPFGIDIHHGVGTACEGWIKIPRPGGVRKGWQRAYAIVCDFKVFLHEPSNDIHAPAVAASYIFDIRYGKNMCPVKRPCSSSHIQLNWVSMYVDAVDQIVTFYSQKYA